MKKRPVWRWLGYAALGLLLYTLFLLVFAPADYFVRGVAVLSRRTLNIQQADGTLWRGRGTLVSANGSAPVLGQVQWVVHPWALLTGSIGAELQFTGNDCEVRANADFGLRRHILRDVVIVAPATVVTQLFPLVGTMGLGGHLRVNAPMIELRKDALQGSAELLWENAASQLLPVNPAGSYKLQANGEGKRLALIITTVQGTLQVAAQGSWNLLDDGALKLQGSLAAAGSQPALEPLLNSIGPAQADGRHTFNYETQYAPFQPATLFPF